MLVRLIIAFAISVSAAATLTMAQAPAKKRLLFLTHAALYKHTSLGPAEKAVIELGQSGGFDVTTVEGYKQDASKIDLTFLTPEYLAGFDALMLMTNGNLPLTLEQRRSIVAFVGNGKALIGVHCATLTLYDYPEFGDVLGGYYLRSVVPTEMIARGKVGVLKVEDPKERPVRVDPVDSPGDAHAGIELADQRGVL